MGVVLRSVNKVPVMFFEEWNNNRRKYPEAIALTRILTDKTYSLIDNKQLYGEIDHPEERFNTNFDFVSHVWTELFYDKERKAIIGSYDVLDIPRGRVLNTLLEYGSAVGISARSLGSGTKTKQGEIVDVDTYLFKTFDVVSTPGFTKANTSEQLNEALQTLYESFDEVDKMSVKSLYESFYNESIDSSVQTDSGESTQNDDSEKTIELEFDVEYYKSLNEELTEKADKSDRLSLKCSRYEGELQSLQESLDEQCKLNEDLTDINKNLTQLNESLTQEKDKFSKSSESYKALYESVVAKNKKLSKLNESLGSQVKILKESQSKMTTKEVKELNESNEVLNQLFLQQDSQIKELNENLQDKENKIQQLENKLNESLKPIEAPSIKLVSVRDKEKSKRIDKTTSRLYESAIK